MPVSELPEFSSFADMQKFLDSATTGKSAGEKVVVPKKRAPKKRKPVAKDPAASLTKVNQIDTSMIHKSIHLYVRRGDTFDQVLKDGRDEVKYAAGSMLIFCHNHNFSDPCTPLCRGMN
jgi:hypothetical protein